ncbi:Auxin-responsive protein IAA33 [Hibiscus syriacus]|uniref:Auxin-responsive protein n=1 Tax=Hibiscus syriacus TaxID=106335 RepID=A0A6A3B316_HIBSY|nr:auxin-responsive protein IAA33-like [Hibiscus syriacus]KAE8711360.1 Auxin-responsive protein IAA33 [Hibiscus syriacus]
MNTFQSQTQDASTFVSSSSSPLILSSNPRRFPCLDDDDIVSTVIPLVTVVLEGRSICQRISLHSHASYQSLAKALRQMFVVDENVDGGIVTSENDLDLSNAVPGHLIAYEDMENDLLLAGDLNWKDFVRVARRIRILPAKGKTRKGRGGT